jgi:hypothetical protein
VLKRVRNLRAGVYGERATPVPIPNTEVKPLSADGTGSTGRVGRRQHTAYERKHRPKGRFFGVYVITSNN